MTHTEIRDLLETRFKTHMNRHPGMDWRAVAAKLVSRPDKLQTLAAMEESGGEPDVVAHNETTGEYIFNDCSAESPRGRMNTCYDAEGQAKRIRQNIFPAGNALDMAATMGIELLNETEYRSLQKLGAFDLKTSSWLKTPPAIRKLGGAIFADRRYDHVFVYHNSAHSFYSSRGFRGSLKV